MTDVTRTAGVAGTFPVTFSQVPVEAPTLTIYSDPAHTVLAVPTATLMPTANPAVWTATYPATLVAARYYLTISAVYTVGQPAFLDNNDSLLLTAASASVDTGIVSLDEVKAFLDPHLPSTSDLELVLFIEAVTSVIEEHVGAVVPRTVTGVVQGGVLPVTPAVSLLSVTYGGVVFLGTTDLRPASGLLYGAPEGALVTYTAGRDPIPGAIKLAALYAIQHAAESQRGAVPVPFQSGTDETFTTSRGFFLPNRSKELLAPFMRGQRVA